nr:MAG TPA: hypothetical protein [Caudoviricetes sp.]
MGGEGPPPPPTATPVLSSADLHTGKFQGGVPGHGDHEKYHGTGHPAGPAQTAGQGTGGGHRHLQGLPRPASADQAVPGDHPGN